MYLNNKGWGLKEMILLSCVILVAVFVAAIMINNLYKDLDMNINGNNTSNTSNSSQNKDEKYATIERNLLSAARKYARENDIEEYLELLQAMMMQESGGQGNDPMQSSECEFNTQFEKKPNAINNPEYSIQVGIQYFAKCLKHANVTSIKDEKGIFLALQSYNYGIGYIKYVEQTDKQYTYQNAIAFSQKCKKEYNVSVYGDSKYVYHVLRYYTDTSLVDDWLELYR